MTAYLAVMSRHGDRVIRLRPLCPLFLLSWLGMMPAPMAHAHPHAWIDLQSRVVLDDRGRIEALDLSWVFDEWYTATMADEFPGSDKKAMEFLADVGRRNLENLKEFHYFTEVTLDGKPVALGTVTEQATDLIAERLLMRFTVPLMDPVDPRAGEVVFRVFDPTYYVEMLHVEKDPVSFGGKDVAGCKAQVIAPNPNFEAVSLASALDRTQSGGDGLGKLFAETVEIHCP